MERAFSHGLYPPPTCADWHDGLCDLTSGATIHVSSAIQKADTARLVDALAVTECPVTAETLSGITGYTLAIVSGEGPAPEPGSDDLPAEGFHLTIDSSAVMLRAADARGMFYGIDALCRMIGASGGRLPQCRIEDDPVVEVRGVHVFLPAREDLPFFLNFLDFLARYRYNTVYLEIAGGMEFKTHPEINAAWERFAHDLTTHPGGQKGLQESMWFDWKDDPHVDLAGGSWLTQVEVGEIVAAAKRLHVEIIPEVQTLAHAYWLVTAHPEIAEAQDDPYPDTYCPSNPRSYEILFDCMQEIVDVFQPRTIHIGHDEVYTMHRCPKCRRKSAAQLFAEDVTRIHDWLAERGVATAMWCDKLLDIDHPSGERYGGVLRRVFKGKKQWVMPPTAKSVESIPRDITLVDWYYMLDDSTPGLMADRGFSRIVYGNFLPAGMERWSEFRAMDIVKGAEISTWCGASEDILARHVGFPQLFIEGATTLWWRGYERDEHHAAVRAQARVLTPSERNFFTDGTSLLGLARRSPESCAPVSLAPDLAKPFPPDGGSVTGISSGGAMLEGIPFSIPEQDGKPGAVTVRFTDPIARVPLNVSTDGIIALIGTSIKRPHRTRNDDLHLGPDVAGQLRFHFGAEDDPHRDRLVMDLVYGGTLFSWDGHARSYYADPVVTGTREDGSGPTLYAVEWRNPWPERAIRMVELVWRGGRTMEGEICLLGITAKTA